MPKIDTSSICYSGDESEDDEVENEMATNTNNINTISHSSQSLSQSKNIVFTPHLPKTVQETMNYYTTMNQNYDSVKDPAH